MSVTETLPERVKVDGKTLAKDTRNFDAYMKERVKAIDAVAASHMDAKRLYRLVMANVSRTPALRECTVESVFRATLQAAELGLEPGSALGEAYLVPFRDNQAGVTLCQFMPGYRGLISLAFRSGHVRSVYAQVVYQGDDFKPPTNPLNPEIYHLPSSDPKERDPNLITFAYAVVCLKDGGVLYDVMTRSEIDRIRMRSKSANKGPWVTDFAEMAKKTVTRRCLKYAPMSVEMSKALAADNAADGGVGGEPASAYVDAEFDSLEYDAVNEVYEEPESKTSKVSEKIGKPPPDQDKKDEAEQKALVPE